MKRLGLLRVKRQAEKCSLRSTSSVSSRAAPGSTDGPTRDRVRCPTSPRRRHIRVERHIHRNIKRQSLVEFTERRFVARQFMDESMIQKTPLRIGQSDKARLLIALVVAKELPPDHTPLSYVLKLRDVFAAPLPVERSLGTGDSGDRLLERLGELERRLALARADEAQAKLELLTYQARYPVPAPVAVEPMVAGASSGNAELNKRPAPAGSPSSGNKKPAKKKKKQADTSLGDKVSVEQRCAKFDRAVELVQKSFDAKTHLKSVGLVASLLRLQGTQALACQPSIDPLLQRCLTDVSSHLRHICTHPAIQTSLHSLDALQTLLPELLLAIRTLSNTGTPSSLPQTDNSRLALTRIVSQDIIKPIIHAFHPASVAIFLRASGATRSRTRRGKVKAGARASREAEEAIEGKALVDVRPGLLNVLCIVASAMQGGGMLYAVLPLACSLIHDLLASAVPKTTRAKHCSGSSLAPGSVHRVQRLATDDSLWYLSSACHMILEHSALTLEDTELLSRCSETLVTALTEARPGGPGEVVRDMLCAVLERIMLSSPS